MVTKANLARYFKAAAKKHGVPGASLAVTKNGKIIRSAQAGVVNINTQVPVTPDAVFQIGSITKPMTATLIMQLVDEDLLDIDQPIVRYLPEFQVLRTNVSQSVTCREFLCHISGISGDFFVESGRGDEAMKRFIDKCTAVPNVFERGEMMSYCNLGFAVMGRLIEVLRRAPFDQVLADYLFKPLGMKHAFADPDRLFDLIVR
jgi:CubicO group peptidase (beta-lactamase class C family)